jgi:hypothetical protein
MIKTLIAVAVAGVFALPVAALASAASDNIVVAQAGGASGADTGASARQPGANPPGTASPGASRDTTTSTDRDTGASGTKAGFERLDRNGDGFISRDEAKDAMELNTRFSELDKNNDGKLSREEYNSLNTSTSSAAGATTGPQGVPGKGPGGQEAASRPLGSGDGKTGATRK